MKNLFLKVDDYSLVLELKSRGYLPSHTLVCIQGKTVYLYENNLEVEDCIKEHCSLFYKWAKKIRGL